MDYQRIFAVKNMQKIITNKWFLIVAGIAATSAFILNGAWVNSRKIDDWQFTPSLNFFFSAALQEDPLSQFWYLYLLVFILALRKVNAPKLGTVLGCKLDNVADEGAVPSHFIATGSKNRSSIIVSVP